MTEAVLLRSSTAVGVDPFDPLDSLANRFTQTYLPDPAAAQVSRISGQLPAFVVFLVPWNACWFPPKPCACPLKTCRHGPGQCQGALLEYFFSHLTMASVPNLAHFV
ncbi:unnamed protein product [Ectocarpus sp. 4 AP-2014]